VIVHVGWFLVFATGPFLVGVALALALSSWQTSAGHLPPIRPFRLFGGYVVFFAVSHSRSARCHPWLVAGVIDQFDRVHVD
jgi:hypothetical protein